MRTAFVIEDGKDPASFLAMDKGRRTLVSEAVTALQFSRESDAETFLTDAERDAGLKVTEHTFSV